MHSRAVRSIAARSEANLPESCDVLRLDSVQGPGGEYVDAYAIEATHDVRVAALSLSERTSAAAAGVNASYVVTFARAVVIERDRKLRIRFAAGGVKFLNVTSSLGPHSFQAMNQVLCDDWGGPPPEAV